ncbi:MAG: tyrosine-type recombinase/integrase [Bacteroidetes bacterium]|nr:tyrosine-type recombinase/integrase [Bacteroidota bacterium]
MSNKLFWSVFAPYINEFIGLKRSLGYKYKEEERLLYTFDQFILNQDHTNLGLTKEISDKWADRGHNEAELTIYSKVKLVKQFAEYLRDQGIKTYVPKLPKYPERTFIPYIYSHEELNAIFHACDSMRLRCRNVYSCLLIIPCLLRLLYGTGIRISEALSLKNKDVNINGRYLTLRDTKNGKDRLVPISDSLTAVCKDYLEHRDKLPVIGLKRENGPFFVSLNGEACKHSSVHRWFRKALTLAEIPYTGKKNGPRIHDIRHTFACHSFLNLSHEGLDLYCSWPYLSAYLGHQSLESTEQYIRLTSQIYPELLKNTEGLYVDILPDIPDKIK